jgi:hypothetical protein
MQRIFVVPLDALLQREGEGGVGAGSAIAIQNMFENLSMLALVSGYSAMVFLKTPVNDIADRCWRVYRALDDNPDIDEPTIGEDRTVNGRRRERRYVWYRTEPKCFKE